MFHFLFLFYSVFGFVTDSEIGSDSGFGFDSEFDSVFCLVLAL